MLQSRLYAWNELLYSPWFFLASIALIPFATYTISSLQFHHALFANKSRKSRDLIIPVVPYWIPFLGHAIPMALDSGAFVAKVMEQFGTDNPVAIRVGTLNFTLVARPEHVQIMFKSSRILSNKPITIYVLNHLLGAPKRILSFYDADDSGLAARARVGSRVKPEDRVYYFQIRTAHKYLSGQHLQSLNERFVATLDRDLDATNVGNDWVEYPDLYKFLQRTVTHSSIETVFGSKLLELNRTFVEDFWEFEANAPNLLHGMPRWLIPGAYRVRDKLLKSFVKWHAYANSHFDCSKVGPDEPDWEPNFGSRLIRTRQDGLLKMEPMNAEARASEDLGLMFGLNANVLPCIFWYILEAMRRPNVLSLLLADVAAATSPETGRIDIQKLGSQPLTQSMYAEVLRLYIAIFALRQGEMSSVSFHNYKLKAEDLAIIYSRTGALDEKAWVQGGRVPKTPLEHFDPERFLISPDSHSWKAPTGKERVEATVDGSVMSGERQFSMNGLAGIWLPFGGGDRMCPGRHYAKTEMIITLALLFNKFDVELLMADTSPVQPNMRFAPFGSLPPICALPFRIRRKAGPVV
ncbi:cytochrome P450 [Xylariaceae sp. FL0662B]|nr:cytochrome P450 [Xylariaceae sp. FL0662B]